MARKPKQDEDKRSQDAVEDELHEPRDFDSWYSGLISFVFHFTLMMILPLLASVFADEDKLPPVVEVVQVADLDASYGDAADADSAGDIAELNDAFDTVEPLPDAMPREQITNDLDIPIPDEFNEPATDAEISDQIKDFQRIANAAKAALSQGLDGAPGGGAPAPAAGGGGGTGRAARASRWVLHFNTGRAKTYLAQLGGLGAEIAFPRRDDKLLYFTDLAGNPKSDIREMSAETAKNRITWYDQRRDSYLPVAQELGVDSPALMVAFLPHDLEARMLKMELSYKGVSNEHDIARTEFEVVARGGGYDVVVIEQVLRGE